MLCVQTHVMRTHGAQSSVTPMLSFVFRGAFSVLITSAAWPVSGEQQVAFKLPALLTEATQSFSQFYTDAFARKDKRKLLWLLQVRIATDTL